MEADATAPDDTLALADDAQDFTVEVCASRPLAGNVATGCREAQLWWLSERVRW